MQFLQLLGEAAPSGSPAWAVARHLPPGGLFAAAIVEGLPRCPPDAAPPLPDVREVDGWVYSSLPLDAVVADEGEIVVRRLRQTVSPAGELTEEPNEITLCTFPADQLEAEAAAAGLRPAGRRYDPADRRSTSARPSSSSKEDADGAPRPARSTPSR